ncbi:MAG TPA: efflux RND transporter periplasmic adaptor subunit [Gemmatimonadales bacterium]|nr:efflux RND transporter periplasmic adaptor subunit [Gemmatimonadales bacterium]
MHSTSRRLAANVLVYIGALSVLAACGGDTSATESESDAATVLLSTDDLVQARLASVSSGVVVTGSLEPAERVSVVAQVAGTAGAVNVDRGSRVSAGQVLTTIEAAGVRSQAAGAAANVEAARANAEVALRQRDASRALHQQGAISELEFRRAEAALQAANAQVALAEAQAAGASEQAVRTRVTSPIAGVVSDRNLERGEAVSVGDMLFEVVDSRTLELSGRIPVELAQRVSVNQPVTFTLDAYPGRTFEGRVARKDPVADAQTRQVGIYVQLPNRNSEVIAGQFARGQVVGDRQEDVVVVPIPAVRGAGADASVFIVENGVVVRRPVELGTRDDVNGVVVVTSGVQPGDQILATPGAAIPEGTRVSLQQPRGGVERDTGGRPSTTVGDSTAAGADSTGEGTR